MKERPILFSAPMVRALLAGTKTQTRRILKLKPGFDFQERDDGKLWPWAEHPDRCDDVWMPCPYGQPGDRLWVRETWNWFDPGSIPADRAGPHAPFTGSQGNRSIPWVAAYAADGNLPYPGYEGRDHWRPSIHMPRWASRILLEITDVRVERLQNISEADARAEGATPIADPCDHVRLSCADIGCSSPQPYRLGFRSLWQDINGLESWDANPWIWVVEFERGQGLQKGPAP